jgi:hypothetical protein
MRLLLLSRLGSYYAYPIPAQVHLTSLVAATYFEVELGVTPQ